MTVETLDWEPEGTRIAVYLNWLSPGIRFKILNLSDTTITEIEEVSPAHVVWSPDGSQFAYTHHRMIHGDLIYTVNEDGSDATEIMNFQVYNLTVFCYDLAWSPDGKMIAVAGSKAIYIIDAATDGWADNDFFDGNIHALFRCLSAAGRCRRFELRSHNFAHSGGAVWTGAGRGFLSVYGTPVRRK